MAGVGPAASAVGGGVLPVGLRPQCVPRPLALVLRLVLGLERMAGVEPATSTVAWWHSTRLGFIRVSRRPLLGRGAALAPIDLIYECGRRVVVSSTPRCCNIGHMPLWSPLAVRAVSVKPVP